MVQLWPQRKTFLTNLLLSTTFTEHCIKTERSNLSSNLIFITVMLFLNDLLEGLLFGKTIVSCPYSKDLSRKQIMKILRAVLRKTVWMKESYMEIMMNGRTKGVLKVQNGVWESDIHLRRLAHTINPDAQRCRRHK